jgi:Ca2+-binding EF-hand superfamily protein
MLHARCRVARAHLLPGRTPWSLTKLLRWNALKAKSSNTLPKIGCGTDQICLSLTLLCSSPCCGGGSTSATGMARVQSLRLIAEPEGHVKLQVRLIDFFVVYDRLRHRHITQPQFLRALNIATNNTLVLSREDEKALLAKYCNADKMVNYRLFCDQCTRAHKDLEQSPLLEVTIADLSESVVKRRTLPVREEKYYNMELLPRLQHIARQQGIVVKKSFYDFDLNRNGCVTQQQFLRGLPDKFQAALSSADIQLLVDKYSVPDAYGSGVDVSYLSLHKDVSTADPSLCLPDGNPYDLQLSGGSSPADRIPVLTPLERRVQGVCRDRRFEMAPFFRDFDKLHSGFVPVKVFARVLCTLGLDQLQEELEELAALYQSDRHQDRWVDYRSFIREMQDPADSVRSILQTAFLRLRREFAARGARGLIGLLRSFSAHDKRGEGMVAATALPDALRACGVVLAREEVDAMSAHFVRAGQLDYRAWVGEVRGCLNRLRRQQVARDFAPTGGLSPAGDVHLSVLLARLQPRYHPAVLTGALPAAQAVEEVSLGVTLGRDVPPSLDDLCDYCSFVSAELNDEQFAYFVSRIFQ